VTQRNASPITKGLSMADIVIINPRFEVSFWGMEYTLPLAGKRSIMPVGSLPLLAALTPPGHTVTLVDENVEAIDFDRVARADIVGVTGMCVQRRRMREVLGRLKERGAFTVVGGAWVTVQEDYFGDLADVRFIGEADETWPQFLADWERFRHQDRYEQAHKTDMTTVPTPRYDLLKMKYYANASIQFSRGCPFQCEFCDIIVTFGRRPRLKTSTQVIAELEALRAQGIVGCFIVDDNLIGNKKAIKPLLRDVAAYQRAHGYPFDMLTEASLDLAEDEELMRLMTEANIGKVFIGIESPNEESLRETKKFQNVRPAGTLLERVRRVQDAGIEVLCGMIVGFDNDGPDIFDAQRRFLRESRIITAMVGMLTAIPKTPLYARLAAEGRLDPEDESEFGTNVIPLRMTREELRDSYVRLLKDLYEPEAYLARVDDLYLKGRFPFRKRSAANFRRHPWAWLKWLARDTFNSLGMLYVLMFRLPDKRLREVYWRACRRVLKTRPTPATLFNYLNACALHSHHYTMAQQMAAGRSPVYNTY
jgi:radical SAM superfamily enzyme YgiQ (UPF0313 family)